MNLTQARDIAKEAWRHPRNSKQPIHPNLLESFAEILERETNKAAGTSEQVPTPLHRAGEIDYFVPGPDVHKH